jgi:hypothetical protein
MLRGSRDPGATFSECRGNIPAAQIPTVLRWLPSIRSGGKGVFAPRFPARISDLRRAGRVFTAIPVALEVSWAVEIIRTNSDKINIFLEAAREFEKELIVGRFASRSLKFASNSGFEKE